MLMFYIIFDLVHNEISAADTGYLPPVMVSEGP